MKITILNGNGARDGIAFDGFLNGLKARLESGGHRVSLLNLRDLDIRPCLAVSDAGSRRRVTAAERTIPKR
jgi:hypothetical protein